MEVDAAGEVFLVFLFGSVGEEDGGVLGGAGKVGWEERHGDGGIESGVGRMEVVGGVTTRSTFLPEAEEEWRRSVVEHSFDLEPSLDA